MRKNIYILLLLLTLILLQGCYYKELTSSENVVLADNETMSVLFLLNEKGYGESNRFITKIDNGNSISIREGKLYKGTLTYKEVIPDNNYGLNNYINSIVFYTNQNGLQGATYKDELISDAPYNYLQNGYNELIIYHGNSSPYISLFCNDENKLINDVDNSQIVFASNEMSSFTLNKSSIVYKSNVFLYTTSDGLYIKKEAQVKKINGNSPSEETENININTFLAPINNIKKGFVIDNYEISISVLQTYDNVIYVINNQTLDLKSIKKFNNISTFNRVDNLFYIIENNVVYIYNNKGKEIKKEEFENKIIGSAWYKEVENSYIKLALLDNKNRIILDRIDLNLIRSS